MKNKIPLYLTGKKQPSAFLYLADTVKSKTEHGLSGYIIDTNGKPISTLLFTLYDSDILEMLKKNGDEK